MSIKIFIDGAEGTTGLRLADRLAGRSDVTLLPIDPALRKDAAERARLSNAADIVFLCLPDVAAREAVAGITNPTTRIIDASTAHRTEEAWVYGLPELSPAHREAVVNARRVANPGCHATGFITLAYPLVAGGLVSPEYPFTLHSLTGYSGAGKPMIAKYANPERGAYYASPRPYGLGLTHKHLPEMKKVVGLTAPPVFSPIIADVYAGMIVTMPLHIGLMKKPLGAAALQEFFARYYEGQRAVKVMPFGAQEQNEGAMLDINGLAGLDILEIYVTGNEEQALLHARFDNLGKGASGAAIQSMNLMCGFDEMAGLKE
jgi:N-acetyl-gamma-glutamyl-phosphate reductase